MTQEIGDAIKKARKSRKMTAADCDRIFCGSTTNWSWFEGRPAGQRAPTPETFSKIAKAWPELQVLADAVAEAEREVIGKSDTLLGRKSGIGNATENHYTVGGTKAKAYDVTIPATPAAQLWDGWGTALKPAYEPIILAMKPRDGTFAHNALTWGVAGLNIDGARVDGAPRTTHKDGDHRQRLTSKGVKGGAWGNPEAELGPSNLVYPARSGRWPANLILSHNPPTPCFCSGDWPDCPYCGGTGIVPGCRRVLEIKDRCDSSPDRIYVTIVEDAIDGYTVTVEQLVHGDVPGLMSGSAVPISSIKLDDGIDLREEKVDNKSSFLPDDNVLMDKVSACACQPTGNLKFSFGDTEQAILDSPCPVEGHMGQNPAPLVQPGTLNRTTNSGLNFADAVGRNTEGTSTNGTLKSDAGARSSATQNIGTLSRAGGMLPESKLGVSNTIDCSTNGADMIMSWHIVTSEDNYTRLLQSGQVVDAWECSEGCAVDLLARQSGNCGGKWGTGKNSTVGGMFGSGKPVTDNLDRYIGDTGTAARFFQHCDWGEDNVRFWYCGKASRKERNLGLDGMEKVVRPITQGHGMGPINTSKASGDGIRVNKPTANTCPCVKPLSLMKYLVRLTRTPTGGVVLDPFMGSGSTGVACVLEGRSFIGIEKDAEAFDIAQRRIDYAQNEMCQLELEVLT